MKLLVKVVPKASRNAVKVENGRLKIYVSAAPEKGKANAAVLELLAEHLGVPKRKIILLKGETSPLKTFEILP